MQTATENSAGFEDNNGSDASADDDEGNDEDEEEEEDYLSRPYLPTHSFVVDLSVVSGTSIYGFHNTPSAFLKVSLASPKYVSRLSRLLTESKIFGKFIQPYEAHVPYMLQFLTDYNCYTLEKLHLEKYLWRFPLVFLNDLPESYESYFKTNFTHFNKLKLNSEFTLLINKHIHKIADNTLNISDPSKFPRIGRSMVELDVLSSWITNRASLTERKIQRICDRGSHFFKNDIQYLSSTRAMLQDVENLRKSRNLDVESTQLGLFDNIKRSVVNSNTEWIEQNELNRIFEKAVKKSEDSYFQKYNNHRSISTFTPDVSGIPDFPTPFQHIEILQNTSEINKNVLMNLSFLGVNFNNAPNYFDILINLQTSFGNSPSTKKPLLDIDGNKRTSGKQEEFDDSDFLVDFTDSDDDIVGNDTNNLTAKLQEASTIDSNENILINNSKLLESFKFPAAATSSIALSQRVESPHISFHSFFDDLDQSEFLHAFNIQQPMALSNDEFLNSLEKEFNLPKIEYQDPYFSKFSNYDSKPFIFAGEKFQLSCKEVDINLYPSMTTTDQMSTYISDPCSKFIWRYTPKIPSFKEVEQWLENDIKDSNIQSNTPPLNFFHSQVKGPTQKFKDHKYASLKTPVEKHGSISNPLILLIAEIHVNTRDKLMPDPKCDEISSIFWNSNINSLKVTELMNAGVFVNNNTLPSLDHMQDDFQFPVSYCATEYDMLISFVSLIEYVDPDIFVGFELHASSWGYIIERAKHQYKIDLCQRFSRVVYKQNNKVGDRWGYTHASAIKISGRQMLNLWKRLRSELNLNRYSLENIIFHIFHVRIPTFKPQALTNWWMRGNQKGVSYVLNYYYTRIKYEMDIIEKLELVEKINEQSRLLGIDFYSIIYRGSQFKVEALLVRLAKAENFMLISPSKKQVFKQDSLECIPLVMEPNSAFYKSPLIVLDFQSLYPSLIIAYNICYSTMLGRLKNYDPTKYTKMGVTNYKSPEGILKVLVDDVTITPNGMMFAKKNIRESLLSRMLIEILNARLYIKGTMSEFKDDQELQKLYNNKQLALKMIANVTYGYTSATYSGRMPNSDIADAIVSCGRETLLKAVAVIEESEKWNAKVVYGDTDSLFVYLPGKTKLDAFRIGKEMAEYITSINPTPVKLKFEKVYLPSVLVSKKRYIGWKFEYEGQLHPKFDAKGIETVRRDGVSAQQKILEKALTILFETRDISILKSYIIDEFIKIVRNKTNIKDFLFAKEVKLGSYRNEKYIPAGARLSMKRAQHDHRYKPQYRERVFYLFRRGHNKELLRDRCVSPDEFLQNSGMVLDSDYYINKVLIPPLERIFNLVGVDIRSWVKEIPQKISYEGIGITLSNVNVETCLCCRKKPMASPTAQLCSDCKSNELKTFLTLKQRVKQKELKCQNYIDFCSSCAFNTLNESVVGQNIVNECCNEDCSIYFSRVKNIKETETIVKQYQKIPEW